MMIDRIGRLKLIFLVVAALAISLAIACGTDDEPAAAPAPAPTPDLERIITDAVSRVPQGASAAEIQQLVSDSVAAQMAAQPGLSRADIEAIVTSATRDSCRPQRCGRSSTNRYEPCRFQRH